MLLSVPVNRILPFSEFIEPRAHWHLPVLLLWVQFRNKYTIPCVCRLQLGCSERGLPFGQVAPLGYLDSSLPIIILLSSDIFVYLGSDTVGVSP